jgi:hypothetical protein
MIVRVFLMKFVAANIAEGKKPEAGSAYYVPSLE